MLNTFYRKLKLAADGKASDTKNNVFKDLQHYNYECLECAQFAEYEYIEYWQFQLDKAILIMPKFDTIKFYVLTLMTEGKCYT